MTTSNEHNNATAVPQGWKLVPIEPTRAMWSAVNKLDDEMAAGSYGGKGCSIEQAWNCMLDFAPDAPAPAPAFNGWYCAHCQRGVDGSEVTYHEQHTVCGRVITDDVPPAPAPAQEVGLTDEQADAVSMALRRAWQLGQTYWQQADSDYISQHKKSEETQRKFEKLCDDTISALRAKGDK